MPDKKVRLGTKAESLERLSAAVTTARVLPLLYFDVGAWLESREAVLTRVLERPWASGRLIVRSSALTEDRADSSLAGRFHTATGVSGRARLATAIDTVCSSYDRLDPENQVLIQPELSDVVLSGVALSAHPSSGAPYRVVNWNEGESTSIVTGGRQGTVRTWYGVTYAGVGRRPAAPVPAVLDLMSELQRLTGLDRIDIEFAQCAGGDLFLLQVRPIAGAVPPVSGARHRAILTEVADSVRAACEAPAAAGRRTIFGVMPDWNPAEMIGLRPGRLSLSLYKRLITDEVWARARARYGYRDLRGTPLLVDFHGLPYIDVRASFASLIPYEVDDGLAARLVDHYVDRLSAQPGLHDKVESRIVISALGLRTADRVARLGDAGFRRRELDEFSGILRRLTERIVTGPLWREDLDRIGMLHRHRDARLGAGLARDLEGCAAYGTEPFAGLARAAFIATDFLDDLVALDVLSGGERGRMIGGFDLVTSELNRDFLALDRDVFLKRYGHLRPGTYDIVSPRYDEDPDRYFDWSRRRDVLGPPDHFSLSTRQVRAVDGLIARAGLSFTAERLLTFVRAAIEGRERAKFEFTRIVSDILRDIRSLGEAHGYGVQDLSFADIDTFCRLTGDRARDAETIARAVDEGRRAHVAPLICLPPIVTGAGDVWDFRLTDSQPNFVAQGRVLARVADVDAGEDPAGAIAMITSADPGYDWLFTRGIAGLVTAFGGINSHMAIRASELGIPAVIGAGEVLFEQWSRASALEIDAAHGRVAVLL